MNKIQKDKRAIDAAFKFLRFMDAARRVSEARSVREKTIRIEINVNILVTILEKKEDYLPLG